MTGDTAKVGHCFLFHEMNILNEIDLISADLLKTPTFRCVVDSITTISSLGIPVSNSVGFLLHGLHHAGLSLIDSKLFIERIVMEAVDEDEEENTEIACWINRLLYIYVLDKPVMSIDESEEPSVRILCSTGSLDNDDTEYDTDFDFEDEEGDETVYLLDPNFNQESDYALECQYLFDLIEDQKIDNYCDEFDFDLDVDRLLQKPKKSSRKKSKPRQRITLA